MKYKYRTRPYTSIRGYLEIQRRPWWWPFWYHRDIAYDAKDANFLIAHYKKYE